VRGQSYTYNADSEIIQVSVGSCTGFVYDGDGNRLMKANQKIYWYGAGTEILDESDTSGNFTNEYVFFGGRRIAIRNVSSGTIDYYEEDMLGSSRTLVQAGATSPCFDADFLPFGYEKDVTTTCSQNYKFEGKERDTETGDDDFGARYYTFRLGRWLSADWSSVPAPVPYANLTNPQTLNLYAMVGDNPESFADLNGHCGTGAPSEPCHDERGHGNASIEGEPGSSGIGGDENSGIPDWYLSEVSAQQTQRIAWSTLSGGQQALVTGGEKAWNGLSSVQQTTFAAITHALEVTTLSNNTSALSEVESVNSINAKSGDFSIGVTWKDGAKELFKDSGFAWRPGYGHEGENGLTEGRSSTGLHVLFGDKDPRIGHVHIDYRGIGEGHFKQYNSDVRAVGPEKSGGRPINNYERYKSWYGPLPGYVP
jgi:RHS repeat-associated protein